MRKLFSLFVFLIGWTGLAQSDQFQNGLEHYENGAYQEALESFEDTLSSGETATLRHNMALAFFQLNRPAQAVWQMERALALEPFNREYRYKLGSLRDELGLFGKGAAWYALATQSLTLNQWLLLAAIGFWTTLAAYFFPRISGYDRTTGLLRTFRIFAIGLAGLSLTAIMLQTNLRRNGIVIAEEKTILHAAPANSAPEIGKARPGERVRRIDEYNDFLKIRTESQATGWIPKETFRKIINDS